MKTVKDSQTVPQKDRIRSEINAQIEEFLRRGGQIDVLTRDANSSAAKGKVWRNPNEVTGLFD